MSELQILQAMQLRDAHAEIRRLRDEFAAIAHVARTQPLSWKIIVQSQCEQLLIGSLRRYPIPEDQ